ncbi:UDP-N-acetylmuramoyl-tripeptide--D-alanyl-D-alanine ligase [Sphingomonas antarctica]|uniref:UDP-N-acetylmuramoyl-tripeptide--D-alanyl-D- alanine ligase n=1 Tax=Sphingomonas antarctica TaxID=2040274 RepID=UPI0039E9EB00
MSLWTAADIAAATGGTASADFAVDGVTFDSRDVTHGDFFVAMPGSATDGHRFVAGAFESGASGALVSQPVNGPHILVPDVARGLEALGIAARTRTEARIAGVTGSVGKTSTKEALAAALARQPGVKVHRSVKSYNNHTGVPLSLSRMPANSDYGVFEMGMNHAREIASLTCMVRPHIALITAIAPAHIEHLGSLEAIADAKAEIFEALEPGGTAIIPADAAHADRIIAKAQDAGAAIVTFGEGGLVRAEDVFADASGTQLTAHLLSGQVSFRLNQPGAHWVSNALGVLATVEALGGDIGIAALALGELEGLAGRGARFNARGATIIDESYNANAASMAATLKVLGHEPGRRIAVLGEMFELGDDSAELHRLIAGPVIEAGVTHAILVGDGMKPLADALAGQTGVETVDSAETALDALKAVLQGGDAVLVKGSNGVGLGRLIAALKEDRCSI